MKIYVIILFVSMGLGAMEEYEEFTGFHQNDIELICNDGALVLKSGTDEYKSLKEESKTIEFLIADAESVPDFSNFDSSYQLVCSNFSTKQVSRFLKSLTAKDISEIKAPELMEVFNVADYFETNSLLGTLQKEVCTKIVMHPSMIKLDSLNPSLIGRLAAHFWEYLENKNEYIVAYGKTLGE